jgi:hypothetical protein
MPMRLKNGQLQGDHEFALRRSGILPGTFRSTFALPIESLVEK